MNSIESHPTRDVVWMARALALLALFLFIIALEISFIGILGVLAYQTFLGQTQAPSWFGVIALFPAFALPLLIPTQIRVLVDELSGRYRLTREGQRITITTRFCGRDYQRSFPTDGVHALGTMRLVPGVKGIRIIAERSISFGFTLSRQEHARIIDWIVQHLSAPGS